jgi:uncharacterized Tic20 family protein
MRDNETTPIPDRNPQTAAAHRRQVLWQITVPFIAGIILLLVVAVLASLSGAGTARLFGDIALIWLILPMLVVLLILAVITGGLVYLVIRLNKALPGLAFKAQNLVKIVQDKLTAGANLAVKPVFKAEGLRATLKAIFGR